MDYRVNDSFSGVDAKEAKVESILKQIKTGILPSSEDIQEIVEQAESEDAAKEYDQTLFEEVRQAGKIDENVLKTILEHHLPVKADTLLAASQVLKNASGVMKKIKKETEKTQDSKHDIREAEDGQEFISALNSKEEAFSAYERLEQKMKDQVMEAVDEKTKAIDIKALSGLYKQISFMGNLSKEEHYEIPVMIRGEVTALRLTILQGTAKERKAAISLETEELGKIYAEFSGSQGSVSGYAACSRSKSAEMLRAGEESLRQGLKEEKVSCGSLHFIEGEKKENQKAEKKSEKNEISTTDLYKTAKAFIGFILETAAEKGTE